MRNNIIPNHRNEEWSDSHRRRHPLEDETSWKLFQERSRRQEQDSTRRRHRHLAKTTTTTTTPKMPWQQQQQQPLEKESQTQTHFNEEEKDDNEDEEEESKSEITVVVVEDNENNMDTMGTDVPAVQYDTEHGMMIDAGSQGTRIHVYEYAARVLTHHKQVQDAVAGKLLSYPTSNNRWTDRLKPGLDAFAFFGQDENDDSDSTNNYNSSTTRLLLHEQVRAYLEPLLDFAKTVLAVKQEQWKHYPIYLKATGGMRALPRPYRLELIHAVRHVLTHNTTFNPFYFQDDHARVISGEEEAMYGWAAVNFAKDSLISNSQGMGAVTTGSYQTYGMLEMGGASLQIGFLEPDGDVMSNLFKLQIGAAKHWNVYAHSFLYYGVNGAYARLNARLVAEAKNKALVSAMAAANSSRNATASLPTFDTVQPGVIHNPCLPGNSQYVFTSRVRMLADESTLLPLSAPGDDARILEADLYSALIQNEGRSGGGDYDACAALVDRLLDKELSNRWCNFAHDRDCSFAGVYQPPLPIRHQQQEEPSWDDVNDNLFGEFILTSNFYDIWDFFNMAEAPSLADEDSDDSDESSSSSSTTTPTSLQDVRDQVEYVCSMTLDQLQLYNANRNSTGRKPIANVDELTQMCFRGTFAIQLLVNGFGFPLSYTNITAVDVVSGRQIGWALGSMLYEINTLPWKFDYYSSSSSSSEQQDQLQQQQQQERHSEKREAHLLRHWLHEGLSRFSSSSSKQALFFDGSSGSTSTTTTSTAATITSGGSLLRLGGCLLLTVSTAALVGILVHIFLQQVRRMCGRKRTTLGRDLCNSSSSSFSVKTMDTTTTEQQTTSSSASTGSTAAGATTTTATETYLDYNGVAARGLSIGDVSPTSIIIPNNRCYWSVNYGSLHRR